MPTEVIMNEIFLMPTEVFMNKIFLIKCQPESNGGLHYGADAGHEEGGAEETWADRMARVRAQHVRYDVGNGQRSGQTDQQVLWSDSMGEAEFILWLRSAPLAHF